jgi:hypothetical protein
LSSLEARIRLEQEQYQPGELLIGAFAIDGEAPEHYTAELSVLWHTEGAGEEDLGEILYREWDENNNPFDFGRPHGFEVKLPRSPLSYEGELIKVRWVVQVRLCWGGGEGELVEEEPFRLGRCEIVRSR